MKRREFITLLGGAALAAPHVARGAHAQGRVRRIGVLMTYPENDAVGQSFVAAFHEEFRKLGWRDGQNVRFDYGWAGPSVEPLRRHARELIAQKPDLIISSGTPSTTVLLQQTRTVPIVFVVVVDPVGSGFVTSLAKPGGNTTGFMNLDPKMAGKWVELLKEIAPRVTRVAVPYNPETATYAEIYLGPFRAAAQSLGLAFSAGVVRNKAELEDFIAAQAREPNSGLVPMPGGFMVAHRETIVSAAARQRLPAVYFSDAFVQAGGLLSYGNDNLDNWRRAAPYVNRILKGEKPADLPVQFPVKFHLVINLKTAKALGLDVPLFLQQRADEVIE